MKLVKASITRGNFENEWKNRLRSISTSVSKITEESTLKISNLKLISVTEISVS